METMVEELLQEVLWNRDVDRIQALMRETSDSKKINEYKEAALQVATLQIPMYADFERIKYKLTGLSSAIQNADASRTLEILENWFRSRADIIGVLLQSGVDVNLRDGYQRTPLHSAATVTPLVSAMTNHLSKNGLGTGHFESSLLEVISDTAIRTIKVLLSNGAKINAQDIEGWTALHWAVEEGTASIVKLLLEHGADVNAKNYIEKTPLHPALRGDRPSLDELMLSRGAHGDATDQECQTPLHLAVNKGTANIVQMLLEHKANVNAQDIDGLTPLHVAAERRETLTPPDCPAEEKIARMLLEHGANVNSKDARGRTPLDFAVQRDSQKIVQLLLEHGADVNSKDDLGQTVLHTAACRSQVWPTKLMPNDRDTVNPLGEQVRIWYAEEEILKTLLEHGADVNSKDVHGRTPLDFALQRENYKMVHVLLEHGANVNSEDEDGRTPLDIAVQRDSQRTVQVLLDHGADVNSKNEQGRSPLDFAVRGDNRRIVRLLVERGADLNSVDKNGHTPLNSAVERNNLGIAQVLLQHGANVNSMDALGRTILGYAMERNHEEMTRLLLEHGANVNAHDRLGKTLLQTAVYQGRVGMVKALLEHGADVNARNYHMQTSVHALHGQHYRNNFKRILDLLLEHGADLESRDANERTLAHYVMSRSLFGSTNVEMFLGIINEVVSHGADINAEDNYSSKPYTLLFCTKDPITDRILGRTPDTFVHYVRRLVPLCAMHMAQRNRPLFFGIMDSFVSGDRLAQEARTNPIQLDDEFYEKSVQELDKLRGVRISQNVTLADVLVLEDHTALAAVSQNIVFQRYALSDDLINTFPIYAFLIEYQYKRSLEMKSLYDECIVSIDIVSSRKMIPECAHRILQYLSLVEFNNLSKAVRIDETTDSESSIEQP